MASRTLIVAPPSVAAHPEKLNSIYEIHDRSSTDLQMLDRVAAGLASLPAATYDVVLLLTDAAGTSRESHALLVRDVMHKIVSALKVGGVFKSQDGALQGSVVTLAVAGLLFALAMLAGGIRFHRVQRGSASSLGGFKGSRKLASDPDVANLSKSGALPAGVVSFGATHTAADGDGRARHERVGSWELRQKEFGSYKSGDMGEGFCSPRESFEHIDAVAGGRPVQPRESV